MASHRVLVIGANRGLGLALVNVFAEHGWTLFGTVRPETRSDPSFRDLEKTGATVIDLDYLSEDSIADAARTYGPEQRLDVLINCAGVEVYPSAWEETTAEHMLEKYRVMTLGPFLASKYFLPNLKLSDAGKIVNITSGWASISGNTHGEYISYRVPKAGLNQLTVSMAHELRAARLNITTIALDPGNVPTKLSRWQGEVPAEESARGMYTVIEKTTIEDSGSFLTWNGTKTPF